METIINFLQQTGFSMIGENWKMLVMIANTISQKLSNTALF